VRCVFVIRLWEVQQYLIEYRIMAFDHARTTLELLKPFAKMIPLIGGQLEGAIDIAVQGCTYVMAS
jgi:hypothetical protein